MLIVDDEAPARERLRSLLEEIGNLEVAGEATNGEEALKLAVDLSPDVVLLDVRMPGMDGIEAARQLNSLVEPPAVIFTTAYDEYAVNAFDAQAVGYLLKPIRKEKLAAALDAGRPPHAAAAAAARRQRRGAAEAHAHRGAPSRGPAADSRSKTSCSFSRSRSTRRCGTRRAKT